MADEGKTVMVLSKEYYEDERLSGHNVCGITTDDKVAKAWAGGDNHFVHRIPIDGEIELTGYDDFTF